MALGWVGLGMCVLGLATVDVVTSALGVREKCVAESVS